jgi:tRNA-dihydrouridine synthase A
MSLSRDHPLSLHRFAVAPMMEWTDRHCRYFLRLISKHAFLYTEMVTAEALLYGDRERALGFAEAEHPVADRRSAWL